MLTVVEHPFIVALRYSFQTEDHLCFCLDFIEGGNMYTRPQRTLTLTLALTLALALTLTLTRYTDLMRGPYTHDRAMFYAAQASLH